MLLTEDVEMTMTKLLPWTRSRSTEATRNITGAILKSLAVRSKKLLAGGAVCAALAVVLFPAPAHAWWGPGWGWRGGWGWGWRPGVVIGVPPVVVGGPVYAPSPYRWVPPHYTPSGWFVPGHWAY